MAEMTPAALVSILKGLIGDAESYRDAEGTGWRHGRERAMEYFDGVMKDTPNDGDKGTADRSQMVSKDIRAVIKKVMPSIIRTILGSDKVVEYLPETAGDEGVAEQATDYINTIVLPESNAYDAIKDSIHDAALLRNGILTWWWEEKTRITEEDVSGLDDAAFNVIAADDSVTVLEHSAAPVQVGEQQIMLHDARIRRQIKNRRARLRAVPMDQFLIDPNATTIPDAQLVGTCTRERRSDLVAIGYDRDVIYDITAEADGRSAEENTRRRDTEESAAESKAMEELDYYTLYVRVDMDGDGIAELRRICIAGAVQEKNILANDVWDEVPIADVVLERRPHQWEGQSIFDDGEDIQRVKTVLLRSTLDNLYWQNNLQPVVQDEAIKNPESVLQRRFGEPVRVKTNVDVRTAVTTLNVPFSAAESFGMLSYMDEALADRTGVNDASGGLAPDALQNMTAKASAMFEQMGISQTELMVRTVAQCLRPVFRGLLRLVVTHQDMERTVRLRNEWKTYDPRSWNAEMDCKVNTGLGAGTRERDMMMMQQVIALQEKLIAGLGPDNPYVKPDNLYNSIAKLCEAAGLHAPDMYFTKPDQAEVQAMLAARKNKKSPEQEKAEAALALADKKAATSIQETQAKIAADAAKEREQRDADIATTQMQLEADLVRFREERASAERIKAMEIEWEREKFERQQALDRERMEREDQRAAEMRKHDVDKSVAGEAARSLFKQREAA